MVLGTMWTADMFKDEEPTTILGPNGMPARPVDEKPKRKYDKIRIPLTLAMRPELHKQMGDQLKGKVKGGTLGDGSSLGNAQSLYDLPKEEYLAFVHNAQAQINKNLGIVHEKKKK